MAYRGNNGPNCHQTNASTVCGQVHGVRDQRCARSHSRSDAPSSTSFGRVENHETLGVERKEAPRGLLIRPGPCMGACESAPSGRSRYPPVADAFRERVMRRSLSVHSGAPFPTHDLSLVLCGRDSASGGRQLQRCGNGLRRRETAARTSSGLTVFRKTLHLLPDE